MVDWVRVRLYVLCAAVVFSSVIPIQVESVFPNVSFNFLHRYFADGIAAYKQNETTVWELRLTWSCFQATGGLGIFTASLLLSSLTEKFGNVRLTLGAILVCAVPGRLLALLATHNVYFWPIILLTRFLNHVATGLIIMCESVFIVEISPPEIRIRLGCFISLGIILGVLLGTVLGNERVFGNEELWSYIYLSSALMFIPSIVLLFFLPESPSFLHTRNKVDAARKALIFYQGTDTEFEDSQTDSTLFAQDKEPQGIRAWWSMVQDPWLWQQLKLGLAIGALYAPVILLKADSTLMLFHVGFPNSAAQTAETFIPIVNLVTMVFSFFYGDNMGRRGQLLWSSGTMVALLFLMGAIQGVRDLFIHHDQVQEGLKWAFLGALYAMTVCLNLGIRVLWFTALPELFPHRYRSHAKALIHTAAALNNELTLIGMYQLLGPLGGWSYLVVGLPQLGAVLYCAAHYRDAPAKGLADIPAQYGLAPEEHAPILTAKTPKGPS